MKNNIPIIIGVTGHRKINSKDIEKLKLVVRKQLQSYILRCPNSNIKLLSSLAEGADQLCAEVALELGIGIIVPLPMELDEYKKDFNDEALEKLYYLLKKAEKSFVVHDIERKNQSSRNYAYRQASIYVAQHCNCLIALWDGSEPKRNGCGTAEAVDFNLNNSYDKNVRFIKKDSGFVVHIYVPRNSESDDVGRITYLGNEELFNETIEKIDELNKYGGNPDELSVYNGKKYRNLLLLFAIMGTAIAVTFLLYDENMLKGMLLALGLIIVLMFISFRLANKTKYHEKYIEYRELSECIRIQNHLNNIGSNLEVADYIDWSRRYDATWIIVVVKCICATQPLTNCENIKDDWLLEQKKYHCNACIKVSKQLKHNNRIVKTTLMCSIIIYSFAVIFEYFIATSISNVELIRYIIKILIGSLSAISLFVSNYYGKLSLKHIYEDHVRMEDYFDKCIKYIDTNKISDAFLEEIIREELSENSNWCSYEKDNEINLTI